MRKIIAGVDGSDGSRDAIALASRLARLTGSVLMLADVFPYDGSPHRALDREFEAYLRDEAKQVLERLRTTIDGSLSVETCMVPHPSTPTACMRSPSLRRPD